jgi:hypothetical protein
LEFPSLSGLAFGFLLGLPFHKEREHGGRIVVLQLGVVTEHVLNDEVGIFSGLVVPVVFGVIQGAEYQSFQAFTILFGSLCTLLPLNRSDSSASTLKHRAGVQLAFSVHVALSLRRSTA